MTPSFVRAAGCKVALAALAALAVLLFSESAHAYAWMIRHEYTACAQCHADPSGGSLLTLYGRAQGELLLRTPYRKRADDEEAGKVANFLFGAFDLPESVLLGADARSLSLAQRTSAGSLKDVRYRFFDGKRPPLIMQADAQGQVTVGRFRANASAGYAYDGALAASLTRGQDQSGRAVSRAHWLGVDLGEDKQFLLRGGRINLPFGLRHIEHTMWVRSATRTDTNAAQDHGVAFSYSGAGLRAEVMAIAGNFQVRPDAFRDRGYAGYVELAPTQRLTVGGSSMVVHADDDLRLGTPIWRHAHGVFGRFSPLPMLVLLAESDLLVQSQPVGAINSHRTQVGTANLLQADVEPVQGVHVIVAGELYDQEPARIGPTFDVWGGAQWFFAPHADFRLDLVYEARPVSTTLTAGATTFLAQFHVYL